MNNAGAAMLFVRYYRAEKRRPRPREQRRSHSQFVAVSGPVFWGPREAPRWAVGERPLPERTGLRPGGPLAPGGVSGGCGAKGAA